MRKLQVISINFLGASVFPIFVVGCSDGIHVNSNDSLSVLTLLTNLGTRYEATGGFVWGNSENLMRYTFEYDPFSRDGYGTRDDDRNARCAESWPPLFVGDDVIVTGDSFTIERDDDSSQRLCIGPLRYPFVRDMSSGILKGIDGIWH